MSAKAAYYALRLRTGFYNTRRVTGTLRLLHKYGDFIVAQISRAISKAQRMPIYMITCDMDVCGLSVIYCMHRKA